METKRRIPFILVLLCLSWDQVYPQEFCKHRQMDLAFLLDSSTSVGGENFDKMLRFVDKIVRALNVSNGDVRVALLTFSDYTVIEFEFNRYSKKSELQSAILNAAYTAGGTNTADALLALRTKVFNTANDRPEVPNVLMLITDGVSNQNGHRTIPEAKRAKIDNIEIYTIGIGMNDTSELDAVTSKPLEGHRVLINDFNNLDDISRIYTSCFDNDGDEFDLTNECGSNPLDLVLLVDTSDANNENYDREVRNFLSEFVEYADVNSGAVRVALVTYSTGVQIEFRLGEIDNIAGIQKAIRNVPFTPGDRNTADALEMLRRGIFFEPYGDRPDAPNALIIITSGNSNRNTGRTVPQAEALHQGGVSILVIGIGVQDEEETNGMASSPANENTFYLQSIDELSIIQDLVFVQLCAPGDALDLIFLFHFSNDMSEENFRYILSYVSGLLIGADIDNGNVRVGAALYRHDGVPLFQLNQYQRKEDIINAIENIPYNYRSASASLSAGIETVRTNMFQRQAGDRDEAPNGLILITDSTSNINVNKVANEAESLHNAGVTVFGIGIGLRSTDEVRTVVSANDNTYLMRNVNQLPALTGRLQDRIPALKAILPQPTEAPTPATEPEPEPTTAAPGATLRHIRTQEFSQRSGSRISQGVPGAIILVTDMPSDSGTIDALDEAELLKRSGISILTVGIGDADRSELSAISSQTRICAICTELCYFEK
ncbi:hypothetical protein KUTeg_001602 [Tegillarca granosa]|uniref:VWFA domain-containing protein n=1 Tax=Tegillarca granosa TaxID=220873 RepID=A0ABQ9FS01_TEGGR|nr:hypothetical protein KUTeg_001602 [Tegillarca granosa]